MPPGKIRTRNPSKPAAADPSRRPGGHWDRQLINATIMIYINFLAIVNKTL